MPSATVTYGQDRVWSVYKHSTEADRKARLEDLRRMQREGNLVRILEIPSDAFGAWRNTLTEVEEDRERFRVREGQIEERPVSWVVVSGVPVVSGELFVQAHYSGEWPSEHQILANGEQFPASSNGSAILELTDPGRLEVSAVSDPHYTLVQVLNVKES